jgi:septum formation protein
MSAEIPIKAQVVVKAPGSFRPGGLVLGSASPRRREILEAQGIRLHVRSPSVNEMVKPGEKPNDYLERIVDAKLAASVNILGDGVHAVGLVVADTIVTIDGEILGKPKDRADSARMIARLQKTTHHVMTRFAIGTLEGKILHAQTVTTQVTFCALTDSVIQKYVATGEGDDKAGAYAVQGRAAAFVSRIEGSFSNVVGLPICELMLSLDELGLRP